MQLQPTNTSFIELLEKEPLVTSGNNLLGDPPTPSQFTVTADSITNYNQTFVNNSNPNYGLTGVALVSQPNPSWNSSCYGNPVSNGTIFLFPGTNSNYNGDYNGTCYVNCSPAPPLCLNGNGTLHGQLCALLGQSPGNFVGFAVIISMSGSWGLNPNSGTCNPNWFNGNRALSTQWANKIMSALNKALP